MQKITTAEFLSSFGTAWTQAQKSGGVLTGSPYQNRKAWTGAMLSHKNGLLKTVMKLLCRHNVAMEFRREIYTVDAAFVGGKDLFRLGLSYPSAMHVLIEHELLDNVEEEMWKLIHWRAPLKVLIFYDWADDEKIKKKAKAEWLTKKINKLSEMIAVVDEFHGEESATSYLFLVGGRRTWNGATRWRFASNTELEPVDLIL